MRKLLVLFFVFVSSLFFFIFPSFVTADFKHDFLYKFQSRWGDIAVNSTGTRLFVINQSYSRIEEYDSSGVLQKIHGEFGTGASQFNTPQGLTIDSSNILYVLDTGNNRIMALDASGSSGSDLTYQFVWGAGGTSAGQFNAPESITTDSTYVYIADTGNNRIQKCTLDGVTCTIWGSLGTANGKFSHPTGIAYDSSHTQVHVLDTGNGRVQTFSTGGAYASQFSPGATAHKITADSGGFLYISYGLQSVKKFDTSGNQTYSISLSASIGGIHVNNGTLYVSNLPKTIQKYVASSSTYSGSFTNEIGRPVDIAIDTSGFVYFNNNFVSPNEPVIQKFTPGFLQVAEWKGTGTPFGNATTGPLGIGVNTGNDIYVADTENNRVQRFTSSGGWIYTLTPAPTPGDFLNPKDVATEITGKYYIADTGNSRILKYDSNGIYTWTVIPPDPTPGGPTPLPSSTPAPYGIAVGPDNKIYATDVGFHRVVRYDANGNYESAWGVYGSADSDPTFPQLDTPQGTAIDTDQYIYVADTGNNRIQRFDNTGTLANRTVWGTYGTQDGKFSQPRGIAVDTQKRVYVSEVENKRIQVFGDAATSAGLTITQDQGTIVSEGISSSDSNYSVDTYLVKLNSQPSAQVTVSISSSNMEQLTTSPSSLVFSPDNWNTPQVVTVIPVHDFIANNPHSVVLSHIPSSTDTNYQNLSQVTWANVTATINDSVDIAGISLSSGTIYATEGATLANAYSVVLSTKPSANVTITISPDSSLTLSPSTLTFTSTNWSTPQTVSISPVHDSISQGSHQGIITHTASSTDANYQSPAAVFNQPAGVVSVSITDIDSPGVVKTESSIQVGEHGTTDTYQIYLSSKPSSTVQVALADASPTAQVSVSPNIVTFTPTSWATASAQTITVTALHDFIKNSPNPRTTTITHTVTSQDSTYNGISVVDETVSITDVDTSTLLLYKSNGGAVSVTEGGSSDTYQMRLTSKPTNTVTVSLQSADALTTVATSTYSFTPTNWDTPQYATVSAVNDTIAQGDHTSVMNHSLSSSDTNFDSQTIPLSIYVTDNDTPGISLTLPNGTINIVEGGPTDTFTVKLRSQPTSPVSIVFDAQNQATTSPTLLTFNASNWSTEQTVTITAVQDYVVEGPHTTTVNLAASSVDTNYDADTTSFVANIADDEMLSPGLYIVETDGSTQITKSGTNDSYTLALSSKPTANVKIKIVRDNMEATTSASIVWFTSANWNTPQTITVMAENKTGGSSSTVLRHILTSSDANFNNIVVGSVTVSVVGTSTSTSGSGSAASAPVCGKTPPYNAPHLFQINTNQSQATLYFTPLRDNISYYFVAYGYSPGDVRFGTSFEFGPYDGVIDYTVNMLGAGSTYYFKVRGGNGCAPGPWSNTLAATTTASGSGTLYTRSYYAPVQTYSSGSGSGGSSSGYVFTRDLYPGSRGADVRALQQYLNAKGFVLAQSGPGSPGNETDLYGNLTAGAVRRFQEAHYQEILSPLGYFSGTGIFGPSTRTYVNSHP